jgi:hypothetical protein
VSRPVYGRVYELNLSDPAPDEEHPYVGMTTGSIHSRVHGRQESAHTSPASIAKDPWKARILPGSAGYRQLEVVYATAHPDEDERAMRRAEAFWIDRLRPKYNIVRPVRPFADEKPVGRPRMKRVAAPSRRRTKRRVPARAVLCALSVLLFTAATAWFVVAMQLPWPQAPWIAAPVVGTTLGWSAFWRAHKAFRKLVR